MQHDKYRGNKSFTAGISLLADFTWGQKIQGQSNNTRTSYDLTKEFKPVY